MMDNQSLTIKRITLLCVMCFIASFLVVAPGAALHDVSVSIDQPGGACSPAEKCIEFTIDMGMNDEVNAFLISFPNDDVSVPSFIDPECVNISWRNNGVWTAPVHPEDLEINETFAGHQLPPNSTTVKIWTPIDIPTNKEVLICFQPCAGITTSCDFFAWVSTDLENTPVESENTASPEFDVIIISSIGGSIVPETPGPYPCGSTPTFDIIPDEGYEICNVCIHPIGGNDPCFGNITSYTFDPLDQCYEIEADFCRNESGSISGYKLDMEMNGLPDWEMTLSDDTGKIDETETDDDGFYIFTGLPFGTYTVTEELEEGYVNITPLSQEVVIDEEEPDVEDVNFINHQISGNISGYKLDDEGNPLSGWEINLYDEMGLIAMYTTGSDGKYHFTNLAPGEYEVDETLKPGWILIDPVEEYYAVEITETNTTYSNLNFTNKQLFGTISGFKFDMEGNGLPDWEMTLSNETTEIDSTETDDEGFYLFTGLLFGTYAVTEELQEGYVNITPLSQGGLVIDAENQTIENVNYVNEQMKGSISGYKIDNTTGLGIPDWEMELYVGTTEVADTETDDDGFYIFSGLLLGTYAVKEELEPGYVNVTPILVGNLVISETNLDVENVNFTNQRLPATGNISGYKLDPWGNGLADWEMKLSNETTELAETETDESGFYIFTNLSFDTYTITEELEDDYLNITPLSQDDLEIDDDHQSITNVNFTNAPLTGTMTGWIASHCNVGQLSVPGARVRVALQESNLFSGPYWEVTADSRGYYGIPKLPAGVTLYTTALSPANQPDTYTPAYYQVYPGKLLECEDQPCIVEIQALENDETVQVNWIFKTNPFAFSMFF